MDIDSIKKMVSLAKNVKLDDIICENINIENEFKKIISFIQNIFENYSFVFEKCKDSNVRFYDYYDSTFLHGDDIINFFEQSYLGENKEILTQAFGLFVLLKNIEELIYNLDLCDSYDELYLLLDSNRYFEDINCVTNYLKKCKELSDEEDIDLEFLDKDNKYKILFSALAYKDISSLEKHIKKALIKKLSGQLSKSDVVTLSESVGHVKDLYDFPLARIQFSDDYRIAYIRKDNVTVVLGVTLKTGKDIDYTRYDSVARKSDLIYREIELYKKGLLKEDSVHYKTVEILKEFQKKNQLKK